jgi:predicted DNA-binding transcriptional regulator AlpA
MTDGNKRLIDLTTVEFVALITSTIQANQKVVIKELPRFLTVPELSELTGYSVSTVNIKNSKKEIPGSKKLNGRVLFDTETILEWIDSGAVRKITKEEQMEFLESNFSKGKRNHNRF